MIELQTLVSDLTIAEFTKLCGMIGGAMFLLCFFAFIFAHITYGIVVDFIDFLKKLISIRKKEKQEVENND
nr:MAG TPA: hypothetical protein [Inoviridae sp.]